MKLSVLRLIPPSMGNPAQILEYPSHSISFPITSIFVHTDFVGLVGIRRVDSSVDLLLLRRDTATVTCVNTGLFISDTNVGSSLNAIPHKNEIILYTEDSSTATAHYYNISDLILLTKRPDIAGPGGHNTFPPKSTRHFLFSGLDNPAILRYFEASDFWREAGISCLTTLYEQQVLNGRPGLSMAHHYFIPDSDTELPLGRHLIEQFSVGETIRVNERGVELMVLGIYGRHVIWLVENGASFIIKSTSFDPRSLGQCIISEIRVHFNEELFGTIDSMELDDAFGVLYFTTAKGVYRVELS